MILGASPFGIGQKPAPFLPWKSARCRGFWYAKAPQTTVTHSSLLYTTAAPSLVSPAAPGVLAGMGALGGPKLNPTSIGGLPAWEGNGTDQALGNTTFAFPAVSGNNVFFLYALMRPDAFSSSFNDMFCAGTGLGPALTISNVSQLSGYAGGALNIAATMGVAKRLVQRHGTPQTGVDYVQWGSAKTLGNMGGPGAQSGMNLLVRGDLNAATFARGAICWLGIFDGEPTTGSLLAQLEKWGLGETGSTNWGNYIS